jgi:hypothetical protein
MNKKVLNIHETLEQNQNIIIGTNLNDDKIDSILTDIENSPEPPKCFQDYILLLDKKGINICQLIVSDPETTAIECDDIEDYQF